MEWISENIFLFISIVIIAVLLMFLIVDFAIVTKYTNKASRKNIVPKSLAFGCQINYKKNKVIYFERKKISNKKYKTVEDFFKRFHNKDVNRIKAWIESHKNATEAPEYLETEIVSDNLNCFYCLLKFQKYDSENDIFYMEFFIFKRMPSSQGRKKEQNKEYVSVKKNQIQYAFDSLKKKKGYFYSIKFFFKVQEVMTTEEIEKSVLIKFKNEVYAFIKGKHYYRFFLDQYENEIYMFDFKLKKQLDAENVAEKIYNFVQEFIAIKGYSDICGVAIGLVCARSSNDFNALLSKCSEAADSAISNELPYLSYEDSNSENLHAFDDELIKKIFKRGAMKYHFRPIINVKNEQSIGYFGTVKCLDTEFTNYFDIAKYVNKVDRNKELLSNVLGYFVSKFYEEQPSVDSKLFLQMSLVDLDHLCKVLNNVPHSEEINLVLMFEETEVNANAFSLDLLHSQFTELKSLGYDIALLLKDENTLLESDFYENFNYFVIGSSMVSRVKESSRYRLSNKYLIESLLQYKRPIIINDLDGWASIELFIKSGCSLLSSNDIAPTSEMILPIEKSKIARIRKIK